MQQKWLVYNFVHEFMIAIWCFLSSENMVETGECIFYIFDSHEYCISITQQNILTYLIHFCTTISYLSCADYEIFLLNFLLQPCVLLLWYHTCPNVNWRYCCHHWCNYHKVPQVSSGWQYCNNKYTYQLLLLLHQYCFICKFLFFFKLRGLLNFILLCGMESAENIEKLVMIQIWISE